MDLKRKSKILAALMAGLGGSFGLHKFYLGHSGLGVLFVLATIFLVPQIGIPITAIIGFFDAFKLFTMDERTFDRRYNSSHVRKTYGPPKPTRRYRPPTLPKRRVPRRPSMTSKKTSSTRKVLRKNPFKKSGLIKFKDFRYQEAIEDLVKALEISPNDKSIHFNIACAYSLLEKKEEAFKHLGLAVENGFKDTNQFHVHDALAYLRIQREFDSFVKNGYSTNHKSGTKKQAPSAQEQGKILENLKKLKDLRLKGAISELEYQRAAERLRE